jgi:hypothetical protein
MGIASVAPSVKRTGPVRGVSREWGFLFIGFDVPTRAPVAGLCANVTEITVPSDSHTRR